MRVATLSKALISLSMVLLAGFVLSCSGESPEEGEGEGSSRSYKGHQNDMDSNNLVGVIPSLVGTRLDDCQTCHSGKIEGGRLVGSSCDNCHELLLREIGRTALETLNGFGRDYLASGRSPAALQGIEEGDSDGDGFSNVEELWAGRYPGSDLSLPNQPVAKILTVSLEELKAVSSHRQFMLVNNTQQQFDDYVTWEGIRVKDLLDALDIDLEGATGITVIAPDGYMKSLPIEYVENPFPQPSFYSGLDVGSLGADCGLVSYPEILPEGISDGSRIGGEHWLMLGYERNGTPLDAVGLDVAEGRIVGEGPLRVVVPQENPGMPDRGSRFSPSGCGDGFDFRADADHNAGSMVRGVIAIRIDPMPVGVEEFDYVNGGWAYVNAGQVIIYGHGIG